MKLKRLLTLIMAVCMVISVFPAMMASAEELASDNFDKENYTVGSVIPYGTSDTIWDDYAKRGFANSWQPVIGIDPTNSENKVLRLDKPIETTDSGTRSLVANFDSLTGNVEISFKMYIPESIAIGDTGRVYNNGASAEDKNNAISFCVGSSGGVTDELLDTCQFWFNRGGNASKFTINADYVNGVGVERNTWIPVKIVIDTEAGTVNYYFSGNVIADKTTTKPQRVGKSVNSFRIYMSNSIKNTLVYVDDFSVSTHTDAESVTNDAAAISLSEVILGETALPTAGSNGSTIAWASNVDGLIVDNKIVPMAETVEATLTATVTCGDATETRTFDVKVLKAGTIFVDSFETELGTAVGYNNWSKFTPANGNTTFTIVEDENDLVNPTNKVLKLNKLESETANNNLLAQYIDRTKGANDLSISFRMKSETQSEYHMQVIDDNNGRKVAFDLGFNYEANSIYVIGYDNVNSAAGRSIFVGAGDLKINQWQDVKVYIDMDTKTFWLYIDGKCLTTTAIPFENSVPAIAAFRFRGHADSTAANSLLESVLLIDDMEIVNEAAPEAGDIQVMYKNFSGFDNRDAYVPVRYGYIWNVKVAEKYVGKTAIFAIYGSENNIETEHLRMLSAKVVTLGSETAIDHKISPYGKVMKMFVVDELGKLTPVLDTPLEKSIGYLGHEEIPEE